jgi:hypothetical protein
MGDLWLLVPAAIGKGLVLSPGSVFFTILFATHQSWSRAMEQFS